MKNRRTDSSRCSDVLSRVLLAVLLTLIPLQVPARQRVGALPSPGERVSQGSLTVGLGYARDTYLSSVRYNGTAYGIELDKWRGRKEESFFKYSRLHCNLLGSPMYNRLGGGSTIDANFSVDWALLAPIVENDRDDLLLGPAFLTDLTMLWNRQNGNNPANAQGHVSLGVCLDNTFRFSISSCPMALQATLFMPVAGIAPAPDYDEPYWYVYRYGDYMNVLHFASLLNTFAVTQQISLVMPVGRNSLKIGYTFDYSCDRLGGHSRYAAYNMFSVGYVMRTVKITNR